MTKIKFIAFILFTSIFASCSSSSDESNEITNNQPTKGSFDFIYNNQVKKVSS